MPIISSCKSMAYSLKMSILGTRPLALAKKQFKEVTLSL